MIGREYLAQAKCPLNFFCRPGMMNEWLELFYMGFPAGRIMMRSEYFPEGMAVGMGGMGVMGGPVMMEGGMGKAVMAGAIVGTVAAIEIAEHRRHRRF